MLSITPPKGLHAEYYAFYFGANFGDEKWAIHYYAPQKGFELLKRTDLFPDQQDHPRANENYYKVSLGSLEKLAQPITSLRYHRITFLHTTWDRFQELTGSMRHLRKEESRPSSTSGSPMASATILRRWLFIVRMVGLRFPGQNYPYLG